MTTLRLWRPKVPSASAPIRLRRTCCGGQPNGWVCASWPWLPLSPTRCWCIVAARAVPGVDVLFVDTGYHFAETRGLRDAVAEVYDVNVRSLQPAQTVAEQDAALGKDLFARDPDRCCALRKVAPFSKALTGYDVWASGLRRDDHHGRADVQLSSWSIRVGDAQTQPAGALVAGAGGCLRRRTCAAGEPAARTRLRLDRLRTVHPAGGRGEDPRAGRWAGFGKVECGMHA